MKVAIGDILQVDGGLVIIKEVESVRAFCLPLPGFKNPKADIFKHGFGVEQASRNVLERRGAAGLAAFLAAQQHDKKAAKNSMVTLELGDALCYHGERCTVVGVCDDAALLADANGNEYEEKREVNEFLFQDCTCKGAVGGRLDEAGRAANLKAFLAAQQDRMNQQPAAGAVAPAETTETKKEPVMKATKTEKKAKAVKAKSDRKLVKRGSNESLFGFSATAVLRRFGKEGVTVETATKIFKKLKVNVSPVTIRAWIGNGKRGQWGAPASLAKDELKSLLAKAD